MVMRDAACAKSASLDLAHACLQDLYHCLTVFSEWGVPYLLHATLCCSLYSYGAITGCLHYHGAVVQ